MPTSPPLTVDALYTAVRDALQAWHNPDGTGQTGLEHLLLIQKQRTEIGDSQPIVLRLTTNELLHTSLQMLAQRDKTSADIIRQRYLEGEIGQEVANRLSLSLDQLKRRQRKAIQALAAVIIEREIAAREALIEEIELTLAPPTYSQLFGVDEARAELVEKMLSADGPPVIMLTGIGGIGKTSLANAVVRALLPHFHYEKYLWLHVNPHGRRRAGLPADLTRERIMLRLAQELHLSPEMEATRRDVRIRQALNTIPHLVVIDNLEEDTDPILLDHLHNLAGTSRFLLTSRIRLASRVGVYDFPIQDLDAAAAEALVREQAQATGATLLAAAPAEELNAIYETVGGNPLALKLVTGLARSFSLPEILEDLVEVRLEEVEEMYQRIYWKAWRALGDDARTLLEMMPIAADAGIGQAQMLAVSGLEKGQLRRAIRELSDRSLLEVRGSVSERRYSIHRLTDTFLRSEIIHLPDQSL